MIMMTQGSDIKRINKVLITGAAGFIGYHLASRLLKEGRNVVGVDNLNDYYDPALKRDRLSRLAEHSGFTFVQGDISHREAMEKLFAVHQFEGVVNLAAQAGVRHSIKDPYSYGEANLMGFLNVLEGCRHHGVKHLVFASSSSVYGANTKMPFSVHDNVDHPVSIYAASKKANELMAHSYCHLYSMAATGLRFFTVYGPWGRPDMALFLFTKAILEGRAIKVFNHGKMMRDFTYIDDIVEGVVRVLDTIPVPDPNWSGDDPDPGSSYVAYRIYNIGNNEPVELTHFVEVIEECLGRKAHKEFLPMQAGDVPATYADISELERVTGFRPSTPLREGIARFIEWYRGYYGV